MLMDGSGWIMILEIGNGGGGVKILGGIMSLARNAMICGTNTNKIQTFFKRKEFRL